MGHGDYVNILAGTVRTKKESAEILILSRKEIEIEVNADISKYMFMSGDQNGGRSHNTKIDKRAFGMM
jgi:hypothetical protein